MSLGCSANIDVCVVIAIHRHGYSPVAIIPLLQKCVVVLRSLRVFTESIVEKNIHPWLRGTVRVVIDN